MNLSEPEARGLAVATNGIGLEGYVEICVKPVMK